jgi:hypothetical protein
VVYCGYAFGGGGSGDSTRERTSAATSAGASLCSDEVPNAISSTWIAAPEQLFMAGQQSDGA